MQEKEIVMKERKLVLRVAAVAAAAVVIAAAAVIIRKGNEPGDPQANYEKYSITYLEYFDTVSLITGYDESEEAFREKCDFVKTELDRYNRLFDIYHSYEGMNNLRIVNRDGTKAPVKVDGELIEFLKYCKEMYRQTDGMTNVAMGSVLKLWHDARENADYDPDKAALPDHGELENASLHCSIDDIVIDEEASTVFLRDPEMSIDVGAIGKGYATEKIAEELEAMGGDYYSLNIGGNIRVIGAKGDGSKWSVGIQNPDLKSDEPYVAEVELDGGSLVTSGSYQRYFYVDGKKYHHIINPETLMPENMWESVSIITDDSGKGDALSTALFNMDYKTGSKLIEQLPDTEAMWVDKDGKLYFSGGFKDYLK